MCPKGGCTLARRGSNATRPEQNSSHARMCVRGMERAPHMHRACHKHVQDEQSPDGFSREHKGIWRTSEDVLEPRACHSGQMASMEWTEEQVLSLINAYKLFPVL
ncbi:hypothetical protein PR048_017646 [Dryococelus australis]|uniref:Uncharacterized protein n=1 Tax=Dryococelus australis TaxID=614101 RepID=A0ABQ9HA24_9NEOP|nr:hypothetical protein PR048_017646 [Dryococelus australis]